MLAKTQTAGLWGIQAQLVTVETDVQAGLPAFHVVGLADLTIREAKERIRAAILNSGYPFPAKRITINLSPAGTPKEGSHFDLPIAVGILSAEKGMQAQMRGTAGTAAIPEEVLIGELSLDGRIRPVRGVLPMILGLREQGIRKVVLPQKNILEVASLGDMEFYPAETLKQVMEHRVGTVPLQRYQGTQIQAAEETAWEEDFSQVQGQENVKRALVIAAAGQHGILMMGSPGCGKTMMAKRLPTILPPLTYEEQLETTKIHSICGMLSETRPMVIRRPFRAPHHTISGTALVGGGRRPYPGEISIAHNGVLFLDELGEFESRTLDLLRQPMEDGSIVINRAAGSVRFPSKFMMVAASNPCKCGYLGDENHVCTCTERQIRQYQAKFSGPLMDRFDMHIKISVPDYRMQHTVKKDGLSSQVMREQVAAAAAFQRERFQGTGIVSNSKLTVDQLQVHCRLRKEEQEMMDLAFLRFRMTMRSCHKVLRVARTIADLEASTEIHTAHLAEALQYRLLEQSGRKG